MTLWDRKATSESNQDSFAENYEKQFISFFVTVKIKH